jgi:hypothetical protein
MVVLVAKIFAKQIGGHLVAAPEIEMFEEVAAKL